MAFAAIYAPEFRLQAVLRRRNLTGAPAALVEEGKLVEVTSSAAAAHVVPGMTPSQGLARIANLEILSPDPAAEEVVASCLLAQAEGVSPFLESTAPGLVTLELPAEKPVSADDLRRRIVDPLAKLGIQVWVGIADTPDFAFLASQHADPMRVVGDVAEFVHPLPIAALRPSAALTDILVSWGLRTVGDLLRLPREQVYDRLGAEAVRFWEEAQGGRPRPLTVAKTRERFEERTEFEYPLEVLDQLFFHLRPFLAQLSERLAAVFLVAAEMKLTLGFEDGQKWERALPLPRPTRNVDTLFRLLQTALDGLVAETGVVAVSLWVIPCRPTREQFDLLERGIKDPFALSETLGRVEATVGAGKVGTPRRLDSWNPDAVEVVPYLDAPPAPAAPSAPVVGPGLLRFRPPQRALVTLEEGRPASIHSDRVTGQIREALGPWRGRGQWWDLSRWLREEWDIAVGTGFYRLVRSGGKWAVDGTY